MDDIKDYGVKQGICPYFAVRRMASSRSPFLSPTAEANLYLSENLQLSQVSVIIYSFHYLLDPKVAEQVSKEISKDAIVVFDEAHNIGSFLTWGRFIHLY